MSPPDSSSRTPAPGAPPAASLLARGQALFREHGRLGGWLYLLHRALQALSGGRAGVVAYVLVGQPIGSGALAGVKPHPDTVVRPVLPGDPVIAAFPRPPEVIAARFAQGADCHVAEHKGRFAGHIWLAHGRYTEDEVRCEYHWADQPPCVWDYDVYVEPEYRLGRAMGRLWRGVDDALSARGVAWTLSRISRFNAASLNAHARLGARRCGWITVLVLGRWQLALMPHKPWVHGSGPGGRGPLLRVRSPDAL
jgi:hypothetical protein